MRFFYLCHSKVLFYFINFCLEIKFYYFDYFFVSGNKNHYKKNIDCQLFSSTDLYYRLFFGVFFMGKKGRGVAKIRWLIKAMREFFLILFPQYNILFPQHIILFPQHIISFPQYINNTI